jgi:hypothetical protein
MVKCGDPHDESSNAFIHSDYNLNFGRVCGWFYDLSSGRGKAAG